MTTLAISTNIVVKTQFESLHQWPKAPNEVEFLRHPHRHIFHVKVTLPVNHDDRELEFFMVKKKVDEYIVGEINQRGFLGTMSCEQIALQILKYLTVIYTIPYATVEVFEDDENGAIVYGERAEESGI